MSDLDAHYEARFQRDAEDIARHEPWYLDEQRGPGRAAIFGGYDGGERRVIADMVLLEDARRIVADHNSARAASEREQRMRTALVEAKYTLETARDREGGCDCVACDQCGLEPAECSKLPDCPKTCQCRVCSSCEYDDTLKTIDAALSETGPAGPGRGAGVEIDQLREELAETRAHEHVLVIVGDMLSRHLEWMIREPTSGLVPEVLDAIKAQSAPDVAQWLNAIHNAGFKRPGASEPAPTGPERGEETT